MLDSKAFSPLAAASRENDLIYWDEKNSIFLKIGFGLNYSSILLKKKGRWR